MWQRPWIAHECLNEAANAEAGARAAFVQDLVQTLGPAGISGISVKLSPQWEIASLTQVTSPALPLATLVVKLDVGANEPQLPQVILDWLRDPAWPALASATMTGDMPIVELELFSSQQSDRPSAPRADVRAAQLIRQVLDAAAVGNVRVALLPRAEHWLARVEDSVRLGMRINRASLGLSYSVLDWLRSDGRDLNSSLQLALPRMVNLIVTGCRRDQAGHWQAVPIEQSEFDLAHLLRETARLGYTGAITWVPCCNAFAAHGESLSNQALHGPVTLASQWAAWQAFVKSARQWRR